ncbi:MAG: YigZ family protein [Pseudomonadota bacterium]|nr:YigZ family protein [Pseudomonadota bacterium]
MSYPIPKQQAIAEIEIKKSRFIAYASHISSREAGMTWLDELKSEFPDARHHCWAYQLGNPNCATNAGMGDDGEPSGTAGKPILNVLQHKGVGDIMIVVVRYFGGIKLGAGGLTRAYGQAAQAVMEVLKTEQEVPKTEVHIRCEFSQEQPVRHWLSLVEGEILNVDYQQQVLMSISLPDDNVEGFSATLTANKCHFSIVE